MEIKPLFSRTIPSSEFLDWAKMYCQRLSDGEVLLALLFIRQLRIVNSLGFGEWQTSLHARMVLMAALELSAKCASPNNQTLKIKNNNGIDYKIDFPLGKDQGTIAIMLQMLEIIRDSRITLEATSITWLAKLQKFHYYLPKAAKSREKLITRWVDSNPTGLQTLPIQDHHSSTTVMGPPKQLVSNPSSMQALGRATSNSTSPFSKRHMRISGESPFERCSPRYHLSDSPDYYLRDISASNPLSLLPPFPIKSSSLSKMHDPQTAKHVGDGDNESALPSLSDLDLLLDWPPLSEQNGIIS